MRIENIKYCNAGRRRRYWHNFFFFSAGKFFLKYSMQYLLVRYIFFLIVAYIHTITDTFKDILKPLSFWICVKLVNKSSWLLTELLPKWCTIRHSKRATINYFRIAPPKLWMQLQYIYACAFNLKCSVSAYLSDQFRRVTRSHNTYALSTTSPVQDTF